MESHEKDQAEPLLKLDQIPSSTSSASGLGLVSSGNVRDVTQVISTATANAVGNSNCLCMHEVNTQYHNAGQTCSILDIFGKKNDHQVATHASR